MRSLPTIPGPGGDPLLRAITGVLNHMTYPEPVDVTARKVLDAIRASSSAVLLRCTCDTDPLAEGPEQTCPVHGLGYDDVWALLVEQQQALVKAEATLRLLIALKDGPRDERYDRLKPKAWDDARACVGTWTFDPVSEHLVPGVGDYILVEVR